MAAAAHPLASLPLDASSSFSPPSSLFFFPLQSSQRGLQYDKCMYVTPQIASSAICIRVCKKIYERKKTRRRDMLTTARETVRDTRSSRKREKLGATQQRVDPYASLKTRCAAEQRATNQQTLSETTRARVIRESQLSCYWVHRCNEHHSMEHAFPQNSSSSTSRLCYETLPPLGDAAPEVSLRNSDALASAQRRAQFRDTELQFSRMHTRA